MNNEINNIDLNKDKKTINSQKNNLKYKCIFQCPLLYNDIVSAIDLDNNYLVYGTFMGEVALCLIDEFSFMQKNNTNDSNITNANMTLDVDKKEEKNNVKEIILKPKNKYVNGNQNSFNSEKHKKKIKDIKIYLNKEPDLEEFQQTEDVRSDNANDKIQYTDKMMNAHNLSKIKKLYKNQVENISCVSLLNDVLNFSVGDYQLIHCEKISSFIGNDLKNAYKFKQINNYLSEKNHSEFCETAQCFMTKNNFLIIYSYYSDFTWPLKFNQVKYENKNLSNFEVIKGNIYMSNFNVPFDFDGDNLLYLEHYSKTIRCINIYATLNEQKIFQFFLQNDFGHISFMKLLPDNCIFLCRKIYLCEIYKFNININNKEIFHNSEININENKDFILLKSWAHIKDYEIISCNVYIIENKNIEEENKNKNDLVHSKIIKEKENRNNILNVKNKNFIPSLKLIENENSNDSYSSASKNKFIHFDKNNNDISDCNNIEVLMKIEKVKNESIKVNINSNNIKEEKRKTYIITLDIEGNFNIYYYNKETNEETKNTLFNLYDIPNIEKKYKQLKFFSLGFPYYITMNDYYYVITTDNNIFVINHEKEDL